MAVGEYTHIKNKVNQEKENIQLASTFSYPPSTYCNCNGRANIPKCPVFYCSDDLETSFKEVKPQIGEKLFMSFWKINCDRKVNFSPILSNNLSPKNRWKPFSDSMFGEMIEFSNEIGIEKSEELVFLHNAISILFKSEGEPYYKTSWIANEYLYKMNGIDFIVYPSFVNAQNTCSMAFHHNFVDNYFRLEKVIFYKIISLDDREAKFEIISVGTPNLTNINWGAPTDEDLKRMRVYEKEKR